MAARTPNFAELLWPGINELWGASYKNYQTLYTKYTKQVKSKLAFEKFQGVTGFPLASVKPQGEPVRYVDPMLGYQVAIDPNVYNIGAQVTREMFDDDQYNYINDIPKMLAEAQRQTEETIAANVLNNGFSSSFPTADGLALFSTSHLQVNNNAGTFKNTPSTAADLTQASLEQAWVDSGNMKDDQGLHIQIQLKQLLVAVDNRWQGEKILKTQYEVDSGQNTINPVAGSIDLLVVPYLTDPDSWYCQTDVDNGIVMTWRNEASLEKDNDFDTMNLKFFNWARFGCGVVNVRGWYASPGA